jgi:hypothetical protein
MYRRTHPLPDDRPISRRSGSLRESYVLTEDDQARIAELVKAGSPKNWRGT